MCTVRYIGRFLPDDPPDVPWVVIEHLAGAARHRGRRALWTTRYIDAAVAQLQAEGHEIREEDIARLSPLKHRNVNLLGHYSFTASVPAAGALRPLRDPDAPGLDEDDEAGE
ncbi:hypothetical protein Misp01_20850 [Microtetraspora sp. NBRC 13810]|nr:hypothetical protein Misp01_20850 [Microtetraspora sp. NBRC 13810]